MEKTINWYVSSTCDLSWIQQSIGIFLWLFLYFGAALTGLCVASFTSLTPIFLVVALCCLFFFCLQVEMIFVIFTFALMGVIGTPALIGLGTPDIQSGIYFIDDLTRSMVVLTSFLFPAVAIYSYKSIIQDRTLYFVTMALIECVLLFCFCVNNFLVFYIAFEVLAFPMFIQVGRFGSNLEDRSRAAFKFLIYTVIGSITTLPALMVLYQMTGTLQWDFLATYNFSAEDQIRFALSFSLPFLIKLPVVPFHLWLVEAHVEAPAPSSMVLAALLLKTGGFGYIRYVSSLFPVGASTISGLTMALAVVGVVMASFSALVQTDLKRMMAYSSVAHMGVAFAALVINTPTANQGAVYTMIAHGFSSAGLFAGIGVLYDRYHTRVIRDFGGLASCMPRFACLFFILILSNFAFPFTSSFVGEFITLSEITRVNLLAGLLLVVGSFLSLVYSMWAYNRIFFGQLNNRIIRVEDVSATEFVTLFLCVFFTVVLGFAGGQYCWITQTSYTGGEFMSTTIE